MNRHSSLLKNKTTDKRNPARVVSILNAGNRKDKKHGVSLGYKSNEEIPIFNHERIFKAKKHDPL